MNATPLALTETLFMNVLNSDNSTSAASTPKSVPVGLVTGWATVVTSAPDANETYTGAHTSFFAALASLYQGRSRA